MHCNTIHQWDNINYDYPQCGGTTGTITDDGIVMINHESNMTGTATGDRTVMRLHDEALVVVRAGGLDTVYNDYHTWREMIEQHTEQVADLLEYHNGRIIF